MPTASQPHPQNNILVMFKIMAKIIVCWKSFWGRIIIFGISL
jgi:hypothetical protein